MTLMLSFGAWAGTITFADLGLENGVQYTDPFDGGDFTVVFAGGSNDGKYYTTGEAIRVYGNGTMAVAAKSGNITEIDVTYDGSNKPTTANVVNTGTYDPGTGIWTGSAASVVFTRPSGSGHWRVKSLTVVINGVSIETVKTPTFNPEGGTYTETQNVEISCETSGATILYSTDGTNYQTYSNAIEISETTTLYAKATKTGMNDSQVATATYEFEDPNVIHTMFDFDNDYASLFGIEEFSGSGSYDLEEITTITKDGVSIQISPSTGNTPNRIWNNSPRLRMYGGDLTISAPTGYIITNIEFSQGKWNNGNSANPGTLTTSGWNGDPVKTVIITIVGNTQFKWMDVYFTKGEDNSVTAPVIEGITPFADETEVAITCETEDAVIYYTLDGTDPNNTSAEYTIPFTVTETTTVKAIAYKNNVYSTIATKDFMQYMHLSTVADIRALNDGDVFIFDGNAICVAQAGQRLYIQDETAGMLIYGTVDQQYSICEILPAGWIGEKTTYKTQCQVQNISNLRPAEQWQHYEPIEIHLNNLLEADIYRYVVIKNATISINRALNNITITTDEGEILGYTNQINSEDNPLPIPENLEDKYDVYGIYVKHNGTTDEILPMGFKNVETGVITSIEDINMNNIKSVIFVNPVGIKSLTPFNGMNIVVITYMNGQTKTVKYIK